MIQVLENYKYAIVFPLNDNTTKNNKQKNNKVFSILKYEIHANKMNYESYVKNSLINLLYFYDNKLVLFATKNFDTEAFINEITNLFKGEKLISYIKKLTLDKFGKVEKDENFQVCKKNNEATCDKDVVEKAITNGKQMIFYNLSFDRLLSLKNDISQPFNKFSDKTIQLCNIL